MHRSTPIFRPVTALTRLYSRSPLRFTFVLLLLLCALGLAIRPVFARQTPQELMQQGNKHWDEKSYELAEEDYRKALAGDPKLAERPEMELRIAIAIFRERQWDRAVAAMESYVKTYRDTLWEARAQVWRARLYVLADKNAYKVGNRIYRGSDVPKSEGKEAPKRINLSSEDGAKVLESFDRAKILFDRFRKTHLTPEERHELSASEMDLDFDLANISHNVNDVARFEMEKVDWQLNPTESYDYRWPAPKRVMYLYEQIIALDAADPNGDHHNTVLARLAQAAYIMQIRQWGGWAYPPNRGGRNRPGRPIYVNVPYTAIDPIRLLDDIRQRYPNDSEADRLTYTIALWTEQKGDVQHAVPEYRDFLTRYPKSRWASDAQMHLDDLLRPTLSVGTPASTLPGHRVTLNLITRNVTLVRFTAYRVHPENVYGHAELKLNDRIWHPQLSDFQPNFKTPDAMAAYHKEKIAEWTATTGNDGKHNIANDNVTTPLDSRGAYIIEARAGDHDELGATTLAFVSDLSLVQKVDKDSVLVYTADSVTGKPVPDAKLTLWEPIHLYDEDRRYDALYATGKTDSGGTFHTKLPTPIGEEKQYQSRRVCEVFAYAGNNRYAVTSTAEFSSNGFVQGERAFRSYIYTDRPLYRPNQEVHYRIVMTNGLPGRYLPAANKAVTVTITGPHGELLRKDVTLGAYGSYSDTFTLPSGADLGDYNINALTPKALQLNGGEFSYGNGSFRVEEYKKPEFEVSVEPEKSQVRVGEKMKVTVAARYFFGAPVVNAKVHYKVFRTPFAHPIPFRPKLAWYNYDDNQNRYNRYRGDFDYAYWGNPGTVYREGDIITDAKGEAKIEFPTDPPKPARGYRGDPGRDTDQNFTISAEVTDDTRRQVSGSGMARASAWQFHAWMQTERSFLLLGDALKIEVRARDGGDKPFSADGQITVWRLIPAIPEKREKDPRTGKERIVVQYVPPREEKDGVLFVSTDAAKEGAGFAYWHPEIAAEYRLDYSAEDAWGHQITTSLSTLVYGPNFDDRLQKDDGRFNLTAEFSEYHPGDTARLLLVTPKPDSYVLFTEQAVGGIQKYHTVFVPGRSTIISVPIQGDHIPNALFVATLVRDGNVMEAQAAVNVPAADRILSLTVTPDKTQYKPGEHATFKIHAVGPDGKPVKGEVSLGIVDEALLAIQPDATPDIRAFFYGYQIQTYVAQGNSTQFNPGQTTFGIDPIAYEQHPLLFPEGMGWLEDYQNNGTRNQIPGFVPYTALSDQQGRTHFSTGSDFDFSGSGKAANMLEKRYRLPLEEKAKKSENDPAAPPSPETASFAAPGGKPGSINKFQPLNRRMRGENADKDGPMSGEQGPQGPQGAPGEGRSPDAPLVAATVRRKFADTAYWMPSVVTDGDGYATVSFDFPDNITQWHFTARGVTTDIKVGTVEGQSITKKNLLVRLQAPRFFVDRDQVVISANLHNYLQTAKNARVELALDPDTFGLISGANNAAVRTIQVEKDGELRVDWIVDVKKAGPTAIKVVAQTDEESDAAELVFPVLVHGVEKFVANSGVLRNGGETTLTLDLPEMRRKGASLLDVQLSPSLASVMLDALPYLEDYPYGCVEQTLSRFVPTVTVAKTLRDAGLDLETLGKRAQELEKQRASIPPEQLIANSGYTYPKGAPGVLNAKEMASRLFLHGRSHDPIFSSVALKAMTDDGLKRLYDMQRPDGSWGWWQGSALGDPYLTAYALEGLLTARQSDVAVKAEVIDKAEAYLTDHLKGTEDLHLLAYYVFVLSLDNKVHPAKPGDPLYVTAHDFLYPRRDRMTPYGNALLAIALQNISVDEMAKVILRNLVTSAKIDKERGSVHWESDDRFYWHWYNDKQETTALVLRALVAIAPAEQLAPVNGPQSAQTGLAPLAVRWLVDNRRGGHWTSTRQTANVVSALLAYARAQKEFAPDYTVTLDLDGKVQKSFTINKENALFFDNRFLVGDELLASGAQKLHITLSGTGTLYWNAYLKYFDMSEPIKGVANAIGVERKYYKLVSTMKKDKQGQSTTSTERVPLTDGANLTSGDIIEVELYLKSDNDYEYVVFEDMKPAGCEAVETRSGVAYGDGLCSNFELRDEKVAFFVDRLPQGTRRLTYKLRAEIPGRFHALPTNAYAMYTPDIRALSDEWRVNITDTPPTPTSAQTPGGKRKK